MKKISFILILALILGFYTSSDALVGVGIHGGIELSKIDATSSTLDSINLQIGDQTETVRLTVNLQEDLSNPVILGGHIFFELPTIPLDFAINAGIAGQKYNVIYQFEANDSILASKEIQDVPFNKIYMKLTAKYNIFGFPPVAKIVRLYLAGDLGYEYIFPALFDANIYSDPKYIELLQTIYDAQSDTPDFTTIKDGIENSSEIFDKSSRMVYAIGLGTKIKFPIVPLAFNIDYRYNFAGELNNIPTTFSTITFSTSLNF